MIIDCHVHMMGKEDSKEGFIKNIDKAGVSKVMLFAPHPNSFVFTTDDKAYTSAQRLEKLFEYANYSDRFIPIYWIDPLEVDAFEQVDKAVEAGVKGFKVICNRYYPSDDRPMQVWSHIANSGKPISFHSGILYSYPHASMYNRPVGFEPLFDIPNLRFAMAHVSWPWCDECLAVYGYWTSRLRSATTTAELFIDTTPGTPLIYREEVMTKIYTIGYNIEDNVLFGTDCVYAYDTKYADGIFTKDRSIMDKVGVSNETQEKYFYKNTLRYLNLL